MLVVIISSIVGVFAAPFIEQLSKQASSTSIPILSFNKLDGTVIDGALVSVVIAILRRHFRVKPTSLRIFRNVFSEEVLRYSFALK